MTGEPALDALRGARIVLGVAGGVAAYKAVEVVRRLMDAGAYVQPVLTEDTLRFVGALTFSALSSEPARVSMWDSPEPSPHTTLGQQADLILVAPCTARVLAKLATGLSDDLLSATLLATRAPVLICPAMHTEMYEHPAVVENLATVRRRGTYVLDADVGPLASGDYGAGRLPAPERIVAEAAAVLARLRTVAAPSGVGGGPLAGRIVVVTAGGTREPLDPVRYLGNRSSGKQGFAIADEAAVRGARVVLISTVDRTATVGVEVVRVETAARDGRRARHAPRPVLTWSSWPPQLPTSGPCTWPTRRSRRVTTAGHPSIVLERTPDLLAALGARKPKGQVLVGFAAETQDLVANATSKLERKTR